MATSNKDFRVKHGIQVNGNAVVGGTISAAEPTEDGHVVTKGFFDVNAGKVPVFDTAPSEPVNGSTYFDTLTQRMNVYFGGQWLTIATIADANVLPDHIHDTSIEGNGLISTVFVTGGTYNDPQSTSVDAGTAETTDWDTTFSGGIVTDQYN